MKKIVKYLVSGMTDTKPENLPEGVQVTESVSKTPHKDLELVTMGGNEAVFFEDPDWAHPGPRVGANFKGYGGDRKRFFTVDQAREIGEWLIEVADSHKPKLRKAMDRDGDTWFEVQPEWFIYAESRQKAEDLSRGEDPKTFGWCSWDSLTQYMPNIKIVEE